MENLRAALHAVKLGQVAEQILQFAKKIQFVLRQHQQQMMPFKSDNLKLAVCPMYRQILYGPLPIMTNHYTSYVSSI